MIRVAIAFCAVMIAAAAPVPPGLRAVDGRGRAVEPGALFAALAGAEVVVLGEAHDDEAAHRFELQVLDELARRGRKVALAMEMFERDQQPALADYVAGRITEAQMLERIKPWSNYRTDYRPLVEFARAHGWSVTGSNVPRTLASRAAREGLGVLDGLAPDQRRLAARDLNCPDDAYRAKFASELGDAGHGGTSLDVQKLYLAQCLKDETMAESVAALVAPGVTVVQINGAFHSEGRLGVVPRIERRAPGAKVVAVIMAPAEADLAARAADGDYVVSEGL